MIGVHNWKKYPVHHSIYNFFFKNPDVEMVTTASYDIDLCFVTGLAYFGTWLAVDL